MVESIRHESFYRTGIWIDEKLGVYVGWTVMENSFADGMPLRNETGQVSLVFSGEDNPDLGTVAQLRSRGHAFSSGDASYLVHQYEDDSTFPRCLNGMFHGLVVDQRQGQTVLFNDRYGMHRLYFHEGRDAFYFAAEAKAILAVCPELRREDPRGLGEFLACGAVLENRTLFEKIYVLPAGSAWVFRDRTIEKKATYFQPSEWEQLSALEPEPYYQKIRAAFSQNLPRYFQGREKVGIALTGGLDTRAILAWWKAAPNTLPCYTFVGPYRECQDVRMARQVATVCGQQHQVIPVENEFLSRFAHYAERSIYLTDGCVDLTRCPDLYVSERARQIAPVKVVGTFGSEILRQMAMFKPVVPGEAAFRPEMMAHIRQTGETYNNLRRQHPLTFAVFRQFPWYHFGVFALEQTQLTVRSPYLDNDFVQAVYHSPKITAETSDVRVRLIGDGSPELARMRSDRGVGGNSNSLSAAALRAYLEFTFKAEYAYDYGMPQWVSKVDHAFSAFRLERLFLGRHKFLHFRVWYRDALAKYVQEMLLDSRTLSRPYIDRRGLEAIVQGHLVGGRNYTTEIHKLLTVELLHRLFLD
ncbi:MAG: hypothetical protein HY010_07525 [Acidobacteria bacterium]|nr:hypothetical protein [Acidobacteriota bacterium]